MKLYEVITNISETDWLKFTEQTNTNNKVYIGQVPKKYITGKVLNYEVVNIGEVKYTSDYAIYSFIIKIY